MKKGTRIYKGLVEYTLINNKKDPLDLHYKPIRFPIPEELYLEVEKYSKIQPFIEETPHTDELFIKLIDHARKVYKSKRNVLVKGFRFEDLFYINEFKKRIVNKPVIYEGLKKRKTYIMAWFYHRSVIECHLRLKIKKHIVTDIKSIEFFESRQKTKRPFDYHYSVALSLWDNKL